MVLFYGLINLTRRKVDKKLQFTKWKIKQQLFPEYSRSNVD